MSGSDGLMSIFKENPSMCIFALIIMGIIGLLFWWMWNRKSLVEKLDAEEGIKLRAVRTKKVADVVSNSSYVPNFIKKPIDYCKGCITTLFSFGDSDESNVVVTSCKSGSSSSEEKCREIVERLFKDKFPSVRPDWLKNPMSGRNLELDMYNEKLKLAFEYDGEQHAKYTPRWHNSEDDFDEQIMRDKIKNKLCRQKGVTLIRVPHTCKGNMESYIKKECIVKGVLEP